MAKGGRRGGCRQDSLLGGRRAAARTECRKRAAFDYTHLGAKGSAYFGRMVADELASAPGTAVAYTELMPLPPEPWLRGPIPGVHPLLAPVLYGFQHAREDLDRCTVPLTLAQIWATPYSLGSVGFHLRHIAGSTDRLMTYLQERQLSAEQLAMLAAEAEPGAFSGEQLLAAMDRAFREAADVVHALAPSTLAEPRTVGRQGLPTTVAGLLTHIAEHTARHVGQAISAAKLAHAAV